MKIFSKSSTLNQFLTFKFYLYRSPICGSKVVWYNLRFLKYQTTSCNVYLVLTAAGCNRCIYWFRLCIVMVVGHNNLLDVTYHTLREACSNPGYIY